MKYESKAEYSLNEYLKPIWSGNTVVHEMVMFADWENTEILFENSVKVKKLLYPAEEIYAVYSSDLKTEYIKGKDWDILDGKLVRYYNSDIPLMTEEIYYPENPEEGHYFGSTVEGHKNIMFGENDVMTKWQVSVTYRHSGTWEGSLPTVQSEKIKNFIKKLENGEEATILFYGDSINRCQFFRCYRCRTSRPQLCTNDN